MRIPFLATAVSVLLLATSMARADATVGSDGCYYPGGCDSKPQCLPRVDMSVPDLSMPRDLSKPQPDARLERHRRGRAPGGGLILLSGVSALALLALRRHYRVRS